MWFMTSSGVRKLTDEEKAKIKAAKQAANDTIKAKRKTIQAQIKELEKATPFSKTQILKSLEDQLDELQLITGHPAHISIDGDSVCLNYDMVKKLDWSLRRVSRNMRVRPGLSLTFEYPTGMVELYELPAYQVKLLSNLDLPVIEI